MIQGGKVCSRCGELKPLDAFSVSKGTIASRQSHCKACRSAFMRADRKSRPERYAEIRRQFEERQTTGATLFRDPDWKRNWKLKWNRNNREKVRAHNKLKKAVDSGKLIRAKACQRCGLECKTEGSHDDYSKPLEVEWLCRKCHVRKDQARARARRAMQESQ